ncbi:MAG: hypothetical protein Q9M20_00600 [Mariprofundaceae bacterium]|nr:hypothetical protein [Mariprofundaceae bacterium]
MSSSENQCQFEERIALLGEHLTTIGGKLEKVTAENRRLREITRLAEQELRKRRDQIQQLEQELNQEHDKRQEAQHRVEHAVERLDQIMAEPSSEST